MNTKKKYFTLTEALLLTLGLLLISAIILPALTPARESCNHPSCINNLKQIGLAMRIYSTVYDDKYPYLNGPSGLQMLAEEGFLENTRVYTCPSTLDIVPNIKSIQKFSSYAYAGGLNEADSIDSGLATDKKNNHERYGNILFIDGHVKGYAGIDWISNAGGSNLTGF